MRDRDDFEGTIGRTYQESVPAWPRRPRARDGAPNVLVILIDDLGFSHFGCFGSTLETPHIDALAAGGLRYTNYHVTPLCSPTRASLLTGRYAHEVGMRGISNWNTGFPNMRGHISNNAATVAEVLRDNGYTTFALGKWHLAQMEEASAAGPYDQWPLGRGFDRFYGFLDGETDQFQPELTYDNHHVKPPRTPEEGYHLTEDLVDKAVEFLHDTKSIRPDRPCGWDVARDAWYARQREMGLLPESTRLAPRNPGVEPWESLTDNQRRLAIRLQEAFAAFLDHTDAQIGRLVRAIADLGDLDNTLIFLQSDNGASQEGGPFGVLHEMKFFNMIIETPDEAVKHLDKIGGPSSHANYPWGWAQAGNTPFKWYKQNTHEGGVHVPLVVHWPAGIPARGELRDQFHHVADIVPTIYEATGVVPPENYRGNEQMPVTGTSLAYTFSEPSAAERKTVQYFENSGHRAIYLDGWKAVTRHTPGTSYDDDEWELYHYVVDRSECVDLAASEPERLKMMIERWWQEAEEHGVLPLDDRGVTLFAVRYDDNGPHRPDKRYSYFPPVTRIPTLAAAGVGGRAFDMTATIERPAGAGGVLYATGTENSGISLFVQDDKLVFDYNYFGEHHIVESTRSVPVGASTVGLRFRRGKKDADVTLVIDGDACGEMHLDAFMRMISSVGASIGRDEGSQVSKRYRGEFAFEGRLARLDIELVNPAPSQEADNAATVARAEMGRQ